MSLHDINSVLGSLAVISPRATKKQDGKICTSRTTRSCIHMLGYHLQPSFAFSVPPKMSGCKLERRTHGSQDEEVVTKSPPTGCKEVRDAEDTVVGSVAATLLLQNLHATAIAMRSIILLPTAVQSTQLMSWGPGVGPTGTTGCGVGLCGSVTVMV